jgi:hypothetical protein
VDIRHADDDAEYDQRGDEPVGDQSDQHGDGPGEDGADDGYERSEETSADSGTTSGTPMIASPMPIPTASTSATAAVART